MQNELDCLYMRAACEEAKKAFTLGEVPVGAVAVYQEEIIARAHNIVEETQDASAHAELLCLRLAAQKLKNWRLLDVTLYTTLEPCLLCAGAIFAFRIKKLVWGAPDVRLGANGSFTDLFSLRHPMHHEVEVVSHVLYEECSNMMKHFFSLCRKRGARVRKISCS